jgi:hypothetical protein
MASFIKHEGKVPINLDHFSSITTGGGDESFFIYFETENDIITWEFKTKKEQQEVYQNILKHMDGV